MSFESLFALAKGLLVFFSMVLVLQLFAQLWIGRPFDLSLLIYLSLAFL